MFRKPKKNIERKVFSGFSEDEKDDCSEVSKSISKKSKNADQKNNKIENKVSTTLLSFGDEEEGEEVFQVKKSSQSKKLMKQLVKERRRKKKELSSTCDDEHKTIATLDVSSLQNKSIKGIANDNPTQTEIHTDDFVLVVKKTETPDIIVNGNAAFCIGKNESSSDDEGTYSSNFHTFSKPNSFDIVIQSGIIPDAAMIHAARKKRQKAREMGDFIHVDENHEKDKEENLEQYFSDDGEELFHTDHSNLYELHKKERKENWQETALNSFSHDTSDTELDEWENQQIRKGVTGSQLQGGQTDTSITIQNHFDTYSTNDLLKISYTKNSDFNLLRNIEKSNTNSLSTAPRTSSEIYTQVIQKLNKTKSLTKDHLQKIENMLQQIEYAKQDFENCVNLAPLHATKYKFYQEMRCYVSDLVECLDEKLPRIVALETAYISILSKYSRLLIDRRRQDIRDQAKELTEVKTSGIRNNKNELEDQSRIRRAAEREGRRTRRRQDREKNNTDKTHLDGMSSDDETQDKDKMEAYLNEIRNESSTLFDDTADEFYKINIILQKILEWKMCHFDTYNEAFVQLCLPKILSPIIRFHLLDWNPLNHDCVDIESMKWYGDCIKYSIQQCMHEIDMEKDPDIRLVPAIIEKIVLTKLTELVDNVWDPLSTTQTLKLVQLICRLSQNYPSLSLNSKHVRAFFNAVQDKIKVAIDNDIFMPIFPKQNRESRSSFFQRQFSSGLKLFRNIISWQGIIADEVLKNLAIHALLNRYLLLALRACSLMDSLQKAHTIIYTLPRVWLTRESSVLDSLDMFISALNHISNNLDSSDPKYLEAQESINDIMKALLVHQNE